MNTQQKLDAIYTRYKIKDYWSSDAIIAMQKEARDKAQSPVTDAEIEAYYHDQERRFVHSRYAEIVAAVETKNTEWLNLHVRYDQAMSLELYELATGQKVKGLSNKKLSQVFSQL